MSEMRSDPRLSPEALNFLKPMVLACRGGYAGDFAFSADDGSSREALEELIRGRYLKLVTAHRKATQVCLTARSESFNWRE